MPAGVLAQSRKPLPTLTANSSQAFVGVWSAQTAWPGDGIVEIVVDSVAADGVASGKIRIPQRSGPTIVVFVPQPDVRDGFHAVVQGNRLTVSVNGGGTYALEMIDETTLAGEYRRLQSSPPIRSALTFKKAQ